MYDALLLTFTMGWLCDFCLCCAWIIPVTTLHGKLAGDRACWFREESRISSEISVLSLKGLDFAFSQHGWGTQAFKGKRKKSSTY